jgi:hypothetical protein
MTGHPIRQPRNTAAQIQRQGTNSEIFWLLARTPETYKSRRCQPERSMLNSLHLAKTPFRRADARYAFP